MKKNSFMILVLVLSILLLVSSFAFMFGCCDSFGWTGRMYYMHGRGNLYSLFPLMFIPIIIVVALVALILSPLDIGKKNRQEKSLTILDDRLSKGEITLEEYKEIKKELLDRRY